jgi:hypothetical protein
LVFLGYRSVQEPIVRNLPEAGHYARAVPTAPQYIPIERFRRTIFWLGKGARHRVPWSIFHYDIDVDSRMVNGSKPTLVILLEKTA